MNILPIEELVVFGVFDAGVPNMERVVLQAAEAVDLGSFGLMIGVRGSNGSAFPLRDNLLWFGHGVVREGDWIFVYTAPGEGRITELPNNDAKLYSIHWGKKLTVFNNNDLVPILFRMDGIQIPTQLPELTHTQEAGV